MLESAQVPASLHTQQFSGSAGGAYAVTFGELCLVAILFAVPLWLVLRAWYRYLAVACSSTGEVLQMKTGLAFISIATSSGSQHSFSWFWKTTAPKQNQLQRTRHRRSWRSSTFFSAWGDSCARSYRKSAQETVPLRRAIGVSSAFLMVIWLFLLSNPH
jgi:hypothetical protein